MILNEKFVVVNRSIERKNGSGKIPVAIIDPAQSDSVFDYKDVLKNQFGAVFFNFNGIKAWGWYINDKSVYTDKIKPCIEWLNQHARKGNGTPQTQDEAIQMIDSLIASMNDSSQVLNQPVNTELDKDEVLKRLQEYKRELVTAYSDEAFKALLEPVLKFRNARGHNFSFANAILIWIQDMESTLVKSRSNWEKLNRTIKPDAPALWAYVPVPTGKKKQLSQDERERIINRYLHQLDKNSEDELTPGEKEELRVRLRNTGDDVTFVMKPAFYDVRYTEQMEGKEDLVGSMDTDLPWYTEGGDETDKSTQLLNAMDSVIKDSGLILSHESDLGGARGVSCSGRISVLRDAKRNEGLLNTMIHEFAHEVLHQDYLHCNNPELSNYFIGKKEGREKVEQQAEITAWIVMREFDYNMTTNVNYAGLWGLDEKNAPKVFDAVAKTACKIIDMLKAKLKNSTNEARMRLTEAAITGEEVATLLGFGDLYRREKTKENEMTEARRAIKEGFQDMFRRMALVESNTKKRDLL